MFIEHLEGRTNVECRCSVSVAQQVAKRDIRSSQEGLVDSGVQSYHQLLVLRSRQKG